MLATTYVRFSTPITLNVRLAPGPRPRVVPGKPSDPVPRQFSALPLHVRIDPLARTISAYLPPIPSSIQLYSSADFAAASADSMDDHAERVLLILGTDPAATLQALLSDGTAPPMPARVPREIANWRAKAILASMGMTAQVEAILASQPEPQRTILAAAWSGDARLARHGPTVTALAAELGLSDPQLDALFIQAEALQV